MFVKKAVFPVAGLGSRFLPATKASPKEMMPIVDKPLIQYAVEEAVRAGFNHMIFVTSSYKRSIEDHFDNNFELESHLKAREKTELLELVKNISPTGIKFTYVRQNQPLGLGHAILNAEHVVGNDPFAVLLADDIIDESESICLGQMVEHYNQDKKSIIAVQPVPDKDVHQYGIAKLKGTSNYESIDDIVEKPQLEVAPSNLAAVGRYIFTPSIFACLRDVREDSRGEIQLTDAIKSLISFEQVKAYIFRGERFDCGSKLGYVKATVTMALKHPEVCEGFANFLKSNFLEKSEN